MNTRLKVVGSIIMISWSIVLQGATASAVSAAHGDDVNSSDPNDVVICPGVVLNDVDHEGDPLSSAQIQESVEFLRQADCTPEGLPSISSANTTDSLAPGQYPIMAALGTVAANAWYSPGPPTDEVKAYASASGWTYSYTTKKPVNKVSLYYQKNGGPKTYYDARVFKNSGSTLTMRTPCGCSGANWFFEAGVTVNGEGKAVDYDTVIVP